MRQLAAILILILPMVFPFQTVADTLILKTGRKIDATKCWEDGGLIRCNLYGQTVGYPKESVTDRIPQQISR